MSRSEAANAFGVGVRSGGAETLSGGVSVRHVSESERVAP